MKIQNKIVALICCILVVNKIVYNFCAYLITDSNGFTTFLIPFSKQYLWVLKCYYTHRQHLISVTKCNQNVCCNILNKKIYNTI